MLMIFKRVGKLVESMDVSSLDNGPPIIQGIVQYLIDELRFCPVVDSL